MKAYKENPDGFKGSVTDISTAIRVSVTGRQNSPDMYSIMQVLGGERAVSRIKAAADRL